MSTKQITVVRSERARKPSRRVKLSMEPLEPRVLLSAGGAEEAVLDYAIVDTGQTAFYGDSGVISEPTSGAPFHGQDAQYVGNAPNYTISADGLTVDDNVTGLTWTRSPDLDRDGDVDYDDKLTYSEAQSFADTLNAQSFGGYRDWRLPSIKELYSLIDFSGIDPSGYNGTDTSGLVPFIDTEYFEFAYGDTAAGERLIDSQWATSTLYVNTVMGGSQAMFGVNFADGRIKGYPAAGGPGGIDKTYYARFCRGNTDYGTNVFVDNGDGTVTDLATGLMWMQDDSGVGYDWEGALDYAEDLEFAGYDNWRLPDAKELQSIVDYTRSPATTNSAAIDPIFNATPITDEGGDTDYAFYWSSTTHANWSWASGAWGAYVSFGETEGWMWSPWAGYELQDVHGAGAQRSDPKAGDSASYPYGHGPQGDVVRVYNFARAVRYAEVSDQGQDDAQFTIAQTLSDEAQETTIAFDGLAFLSGDLGADSFLPPGKVADFWGFQYLRDNDPSSMGHNTDFLTSAANNVLYTLTDSQVEQLVELAEGQVDSINQYAYDRFPLMDGFRRELEGNLPEGTTGLDASAVEEYSAGLYRLDGEISLERAEAMGGILSSLSQDQRDYLDAMAGQGMTSWPDVGDQIDRATLSHDVHVAVMTYAADLFSWYSGSVDADVYFCPERQGTYFGSFYLKDAPAMGNPDYTIDSNLTANAGRDFLATLTPEQVETITDLVGQQREALYEIVDTREQVATELRKFIAGESADSAAVLALMERYGELDGHISYLYATTFAEVSESLTSEQTALLADLRAQLGVTAPTGAYLYSEPMDMPEIGDTDFLFSDNVDDEPVVPPTQTTHTLTPGRDTGSWSFVDGDGDSVTVTLGGRTGSVTITRGVAEGEQGDIVSIEANDTDLGSVLAIDTPQGGETTVGDVMVHGSLGRFDGRTTDLLGSFTVDGTIDTLLLDDVADDHTIAIGRPNGVPVGTTVELDHVSDLTIDTQTPIRFLTATEWLDAGGSADVVRAPWIDALTVAGDFEADVAVGGADIPTLALGVATVTGDVVDSTWTVAGDAGSIAIGDAENWALAVSGDLDSLAMAAFTGAVDVDGDVGSISAHGEIAGRIAVGGNLNRLDAHQGITEEGRLDVGGDLGRYYRFRRRGRRRWAVEGLQSGGDVMGTVSVGGTAYTMEVDGRIGGPVEIGGDAESIVADGVEGAITVHGNVGVLESHGQIQAAIQVDGNVNRLDAQEGTSSAGSIDVGGDLGRLYRVRRNGRRRWVTEGLESGGDVMGAVSVGGTAYTMAVDGQIGGPVEIDGDAERIVANGIEGAITVHGNVGMLESHGKIQAAIQVDGNVNRIDAHEGTSLDGTIDVGGDLGRWFRVRRNGRRRWVTEGFQSGGDVLGAIAVDGTAYTLGVDGSIGGTVEIGSDAESIVANGIEGAITVHGNAGAIESHGQIQAAITVEGSVNRLDAHEGTSSDASIDVGGDLGRQYRVWRNGRRRWVTEGFQSGGDVDGSLTVGGSAQTIDVDGRIGGAITVHGNVGTMESQGQVQAAVQVDGDVGRLEAHEGISAEGNIDVGGDLGREYRVRRRGRRRWVTEGFESGGDVQGDITVGGRLVQADIEGDLADASVTANEINGVSVGGVIRSTESRTIRSLLGGSTFYVSDSTWSGTIGADSLHVFDESVTAQIG